MLELLVEFEFRGLVGEGIHDFGAGKLFPFVNERVSGRVFFFLWFCVLIEEAAISVTVGGGCREVYQGV